MELSWATYYGDSGDDGAGDCSFDRMGRLIVCGGSFSNSLNTNNLATSAAFQSSIVGLADGFLAVFDSVGNRHWGTYYGAVNDLSGFGSCSSDDDGRIYARGNPNNGSSGLSTSGAFQTSNAGGYDSYLVQFACTSQGLNLTANTPLCSGRTLTLTANAASSVTVSKYQWTGPGSFTSSIPNPTIIVQPLNSGNYTLNAWDATYCMDQVTTTVSVLLSPTISIASGSVCEQGTFTLVPLGALNYSYLPTGPAVTPPSTTVFTVSGSAANGCTTSALATVSVMPLPSLIINSSQPFICKGTSATLTASGASSYSWSTGAQISTVVVSPSSNSSYTLVGYSKEGCSAVKIVNVIVSNCDGIEEIESGADFIYPNPAHERCSISIAEPGWVNISDLSGRVMQRTYFEPGQRDLHLEVPPGVYVITIDVEKARAVYKLIVQ